ncbi:MAG TPA: glycosyltransferase family 39 protein [Thermomicrobiaceae bacterium]|nr:glycosyltransferase family 39 protein [Thermomicrobiaceae bacterium]
MEPESLASQHSAASVPAVERPATALLVALAGVSFVAHMLVAGNYGYFRDELYYLADGRHLQAGYVDQPLLMGWLAALLRVTAGDSLVAIHVTPALAAALIVLATGLLARELGGGRIAQLVAGVAALFTLAFMATGSLFSMDVLDQLWWALAGLILARLLRRDAPRLWLLVGLVAGVALLTKLTVLFFGLALVLGLLVTPERRSLRTPWPWLGGGLAVLGLLPYLIWNAVNGWPTVEFWRHYGGVGTSLAGFLATQVGLLNPLVLPLAVAGLVFYFRPSGARYRLLGWTFVFALLVLAALRTKPYFLAPAYPILFAGGAVAFERFQPRRWLGWIRPAYVALIVLTGVLLAPDVMPILSPATTARVYGTLQQPLADRLGWQSLTDTVEQVYAALPPAERAQACVVTSNYGEAGALQQLAAPGRLPPVISGHNNYSLWGPGTCTGEVLITVGFDPNTAEMQGARTIYTHVTLAATDRCQYCVAYEQTLPIYVLSGATSPIFPGLWSSLKHYD